MILALLAWFGALSTSADSPGPPPEPLHPRDHRSTDERWVLHVDPSRRDGVGPAECRMSRSGVLVWARQLPFTLREACVTNEGGVIGYAHAYLRPYEGELTLVVLAPDGSERLVEREPSCSESGRIRNLPERLELFEREDRALLRLGRRASGLHEWRLYSLSGAAASVASRRVRRSFPRRRRSPVLGRASP